ncbi:hypothetical protein AVEN_116699-1 [Araneus ventricosus]|uniref:Uncharacterized protein n=1 Tax=Araneus ventricosus TaxID=182803 RepID=A0A4Y2EHR0_ARAVE|nr:hypothetical protein AVEN_116699-1 [Araneus ventricosus]
MGSPTSPQAQESLSDKWKLLRNERNGACPVTNRTSSSVHKTGFRSTVLSILRTESPVFPSPIVVVTMRCVVYYQILGQVSQREDRWSFCICECVHFTLHYDTPLIPEIKISGLQFG